MMSLQDILRKYDNPELKVFEYYEVLDDLRQLSDDQLQDQHVQFEQLAMSFSEQRGDREWGTYFGPTFVGVSKATNEKVYTPDIKSVTESHISYWEERALQTQNPLMRMRYAGLVFDFKKKLFNKEADYRQIKLPYVNAILDVIDGMYYKYSVQGSLLLERAFECANALHNQDLINRAKNSLFVLNNRYKDELESPGLWAKPFGLMIEYKSLFTYEEKQQLLQEHEARFEFLMDSCKKDGGRTDKYVHWLKDEATLLCDYYVTIADKDKIISHLDDVSEAIRISSEARGAMWLQGMLTQMQNIYRKYHLYKSANKLYVDIQAAGGNVMEGMQRFEASIQLSQDQIEQYKRQILQGTNEEIIQRYIASNIPNVAYEKQQLKEEARHAPLLSIIPTVLMDAQGNPHARFVMGDGEDWNALMYSMWKRMLMQALFLRIQIETMENKGIFTYESVMERMTKCPLIAEGHIEIVERGMQAYFEKDYLLACHLLVPQFESAIRQLVQLSGGEIMRHNADPKDGDEYISLGGLLESPEVKNVFQEDEIVYFKNLFVEKAGGNIRNMVTHGLYPIGYFNNTLADRVVQALMVLSNVTEKEDE